MKITTYKNTQDTCQHSSQREILALNACIRIGESNIVNPKLSHRKLQKGVQFKSKASRKKKEKEMIKIRAKINESENTKQQRKSMKLKASSQKKINNIDKTLA